MNDELLDNKLTILYVLQEAKRPLTLEQILKLCENLECTYFDISQYVQELLAKQYISQTIYDDYKYYSLTDTGLHMLSELIELVSGVDLLSLKNLIQGSIKDYKSSYKIDTTVSQIKGEEYRVNCYIKDGNDELISINLYAGDIENAKKISNHWKDNGNELYNKILDLMTK